MSKPEIKSGKEHLARLRDGREIFINGARVDDVTSHSAFRTYDWSAADSLLQGILDSYSLEDSLEADKAA